MKKAIDQLINKITNAINSFRRKAESYAWLAHVLAALGLIAYLLQATNYMFSSRSILDEGLYLLKGYYFAIGKFTPFQDYGVLTNHMPLSFVIPGMFQKWFGPGLIVGRVYSLVAGLLMLVGIWIAGKRLGGKWWAAFAVWAIALNVSLVKTYSVAFSQVLVALIVSWILAFALGRKRKPWQAIMAGALAGLLVMTRINMTPLAGLLIVYYYFQYGAKAAAMVGGSALAVVVGVHAIYWPGILRIWAYWIPDGLIPQLESFYPPWKETRTFTSSPFNVWIRNLDDITWNPIVSFWNGLRFNFAAIVGVLVNLFLWPSRGAWKNKHRQIAALFLNGLFLVLLGIHMWASLSGASCHSFCFSGYVGFFNIIGLLAIVATAPYWRKESGTVRILASLSMIVILFTGVGFGSFDATGKWLADLEIPRALSFTSGEANPTLWGIMQNKFGLEYRFSRQVLPAIAGFALAVTFIGTAILWLRFVIKKGLRSLPYSLLAIILSLGILLSPTVLLGGGDRNLNCSGNIVANYERIASQVRDAIPAGASVYYRGSNSPIALLYTEDVQIYPPQLNNVFSFSENPSADIADDLLRFGQWNDSLREKWRREADYVILEGRRYAEWEAQIESGEFGIELISDPMEPCRGKASQLIVLSRSKD